ncbi:RagB/SusD family nutrient uptake outer membrane protein [Pedobacter sp. Du54]|uniref:RagB/SusD family nutrient uptake outer membrane protein n=1 Tax=Pedobacter anseongensis TaxID=3133439 RepID=UPI00309B5541
MTKKHLSTLIAIITIVVTLSSCKKYLDAKSNQAFVTPQSLEDLQALLDNSSQINLGQYPGLLEMQTDDFFLSYTQLSSLTPFEQETYIWSKQINYDQSATNQNWLNSFRPVFISNAVLDELPGIDESDREFSERVEGSALFLRAFSFWNLAQIFCPAYEKGNSNNLPGLPLRTTPDFNVPSVRSTVVETYTKIIDDLKKACRLLPAKQLYPTRPSKWAAFAALSRTYLSMEEYSLANIYADSCLQIDRTLIDYNTLTPSAARPFAVFHPETIFFSYSNGASILNPTRANIDTLLYRSYVNNDLRKTIFFQNSTSGNVGFKGSYSGSLSGTFFNGLATDEQYLIKAECLAREGKSTEAMAWLNNLLMTRWSNKGTPYQNLSASNADEALSKILVERRKELLMRGLRWSDLRRLNRDPRFEKNLFRIIDTGKEKTTYILKPRGLNYIMLIPSEVIRISGMQQNPRE